jgi:hypothetical protein
MNNVDVGDTLLLYTMLVPFGGNTVIGPGGDEFWTTHNPNQVFHLVAYRNNNTIINFKERREGLKGMIWLLPVMSLIFFAWFLYRRLGIESPFIMES